MTAYDPKLHTGEKGFFGWLNRIRPGQGDLTDLSALAGHLRLAAPGSRSDTIANIAEFLYKHDLDVCGVTLGVSHDYVSGVDPLLMRLIHEREMIGQEITVDWLKKLRGQHKEDAEANEVHRAFEKLEQQLVEFGVSASAARKATQDYGSSLEGHAEQLGAARDLNISVADLLNVVRGMIDRTTEMERDMSRSEEQSEALRRNLEAAVRAAEEDYLTGLPNRRAFEKTFENQYRDARHAREQLVVGVCDIDHFKRINDTHGHETGDRVLKAVARNLSEISSDGCFIARHGGEEFVILFRGRTLDQARKMLDDARAEMAERRMVNRTTKTPIGHVTFSAGIAEVFSYPDRKAAMKAADGALYQAKGMGRNQIVVA